MFDEHEDDERGRENVARGQNGDMTGAMEMDDIWIPLLAMVFLPILFGVQPRTNQKSILDASSAMRVSVVICNRPSSAQDRDRDTATFLGRRADATSKGQVECHS